MYQDMQGHENDKIPINFSFSDEHFLAIKRLDAPWYADFVNYLACRILPPDLSFSQKKKTFVDIKHYGDEPLLYRKCVDTIYQRCVPEDEIHDILHHCHSSSYGGHIEALKTTSKVLQVVVYCPHLFKDTREYVLAYDSCQKTGNTTRRHEMTLNNTLEVELMFGELII